ncbi:Vta1 like-domain-containing protein [Trametes polyzona]|nr:Vta1 like-domain-containing protein [Trametes polyzona]
MVLALPPIPPELKSITPYLQRADELSTKDPVIAYWCAYYAAQQGIALKAKGASTRQFLIELLGLLEQMKTELGANDAVHDEPASAAYVENFALRIFAGADNEDRKGNATRNTAKKFLAAANFLELLRVFEADKAGIDISGIEEKIKYSKWKAADIAKAFREGRKPTPGPPGFASEESLALPDASLPDPNAVTPTTPPSAGSSLPSGSSPPSITRSVPPPPQLTGLTPREPSDHLSAGPSLPDGLAPPQPPQSPGSWSTAATPGSPTGFRFEDGSSSVSTPVTSGKRTVFVSDELEGRPEGEALSETPSPTSAAKSVRFSPSVVGGMSTPGEGPGGGLPGQDPFSVHVVVSSPPASPQVTVPKLSSSAPSSPATKPPSLPHHPAPPPPPRGPQQPIVPPPNIPHSSVPYQDATTATVTTSPPELTPQVVARVQKHCKYAISALDYEDAEQAIKELRAALRMLGG